MLYVCVLHVYMCADYIPGWFIFHISSVSSCDCWIMCWYHMYVCSMHAVDGQSTCATHTHMQCM